MSDRPLELTRRALSQMLLALPLRSLAGADEKGDAPPPSPRAACLAATETGLSAEEKARLEAAGAVLLGTLDVEWSDPVGGMSTVCGLPAISVPCGFGRGGLPVGLTIVAGAFEEAKMFALAKLYQGATDWHRRRPPVG